MQGKIYFDTLMELSEFLSAFVGSTAIFEVRKNHNQWVLEFMGGF